MDVPKAIPLPNLASAAFLIDVYDWDQLLLQSSSENQLLSRLLLCTGPLPCALSMHGVGPQRGILEVSGSGSLACLGTYGCSSIVLRSIQLNCERAVLPSKYSTIEAAGALLMLSNITMNGCWSGSDGASVKVYAGAIVQVGLLNLVKLFFSLKNVFQDCYYFIFADQFINILQQPQRGPRRRRERSWSKPKHCRNAI